MEIYKIKNLTFNYPEKESAALSDIDFSVSKGEFLTICGKSGCGKTTLLRLLKTALAPAGKITGTVFYDGKPLPDVDIRRQASEIGFVMQNPDNQIVTDKVWHELAFGLESLAYKTEEIRARVAEMASFFGIQNWFHKKVSELSGGQKQMLNLASVMVMQPSVIILDEPTSQLDPIAAHEFLKAVEKINRELGTTVIMTEHRLEEAFPVSDRVIVMDSGKIIADGAPCEIGEKLKLKSHVMFNALPAPMRVHSALQSNQKCPVTVREGRLWLEQYSSENELFIKKIPESLNLRNDNETIIELKDVWFRYEKDAPDIIKGLSLKVKKGEIFSVIGGNGTGKTTALSIISGLNKPHMGKVLIDGKDIESIKNLYDGVLGVLPQNPQTLFVKKTVQFDLLDMFLEAGLSDGEKLQAVNRVLTLCEIQNLANNHPYDLSGGEQQRVALAKVLLTNPSILLMDEPTKGMDAGFKARFGEILKTLTDSGVTVIMVSHDIEFCAEYADRCAMLFDGELASQAAPREFFSGKSFYTTSANRMARGVLPKAILADDIILACGGETKKICGKPEKINLPVTVNKRKTDVESKDMKKVSVRIVLGIIFAVMFCITAALMAFSRIGETHQPLLKNLAVAETVAILLCIYKKNHNTSNADAIKNTKNTKKQNPASILLSLGALALIVITVFWGVYALDDRKYYLISMLVILEAFIPFFAAFEKRKSKARELVIISVLCALAVAGRTVFFMMMQFKPVVAIIIISAVCFGKDAGFIVGALTGLVSNFFFGQGPWTPWQMLSFGAVGFVAGLCSECGILAKKRINLCIFGALVTVIVYGGIINPAAVIMYQENPTLEMIVSAYAMGLPFDLIHAASTAVFLWFIGEPMIEKLDRIIRKYNLL